MRPRFYYRRTLWRDFSYAIRELREILQVLSSTKYITLGVNSVGLAGRQYVNLEARVGSYLHVRRCPGPV